jgi:iron complex transport system permease protein
LWQIRFPRVTAAVIVGAALGVAGLLAQGACNNAVAEPAILGTAAGASFGAVLAISAGLVQVGTIGAIACHLPWFRAQMHVQYRSGALVPWL